MQTTSGTETSVATTRNRKCRRRISIDWQKRAHDSAEDSISILPTLIGRYTAVPIRSYLLQQTISLALSIRQGRWKLLDHKGSGGNNYQRNNRLRQFLLPEAAPDAPGQLYDLDADPGETTNLYEKHPQVVARLKKLLEETKASGRSRR